MRNFLSEKLYEILRKKGGWFLYYKAAKAPRNGLSAILEILHLQKRRETV